MQRIIFDVWGVCNVTLSYVKRFKHSCLSGGACAKYRLCMFGAFATYCFHILSVCNILIIWLGRERRINYVLQRPTHGVFRRGSASVKRNAASSWSYGYDIKGRKFKRRPDFWYRGWVRFRVLLRDRFLAANRCNATVRYIGLLPFLGLLGGSTFGPPDSSTLRPRVEPNIRAML